MSAYFLVGLGGALGAMARYAVARLIPAVGFPVPTLVVNVLGSLLMGILAAALARWSAGWSEAVRLLIGVGFLGGFTTFSAFSLDTLVLVQRGEWVLAAGYVLVSVAVSMAAIGLGFSIMRGVA